MKPYEFATCKIFSRITVRKIMKFNWKILEWYSKSYWQFEGRTSNRKQAKCNINDEKYCIWNNETVHNLSSKMNAFIFKNQLRELETNWENNKRIKRFFFFFLPQLKNLETHKPKYRYKSHRRKVKYWKGKV